MNEMVNCRSKLLSITNIVGQGFLNQLLNEAKFVKLAFYVCIKWLIVAVIHISWIVRSNFKQHVPAVQGLMYHV